MGAQVGGARDRRWRASLTPRPVSAGIPPPDNRSLPRGRSPLRLGERLPNLGVSPRPWPSLAAKVIKFWQNFRFSSGTPGRAAIHPLNAQKDSGEIAVRRAMTPVLVTTIALTRPPRRSLVIPQDMAAPLSSAIVVDSVASGVLACTAPMMSTANPTSFRPRTQAPILGARMKLGSTAWSAGRMTDSEMGFAVTN